MQYNVLTNICIYLYYILEFTIQYHKVQSIIHFVCIILFQLNCPNFIDLYLFIYTAWCIFSSPEPKAQVGWLSVVIVVDFIVNFFFTFLSSWTQNCNANFNQPWHKASFGKGDSRFSNEGFTLLQGEIITK